MADPIAAKQYGVNTASLAAPPPADRPLGQSRALVLPACAYLPEGSGRCPSLGRRLAAIEPFLVS